MANVSEKFGLRPYRKLDGTPLAGAQNRYTVKANYGTAIFTGLFNLSFYIGNMQGSIKSANRYNLIKNQKIIHKMEYQLHLHY